METADDEKIITLLERLKTSSENINEDELISILSATVKSCHVPCRDAPEDVPYDATEFENVAREAEMHLCILLRLLDSIHKAKKEGQKFSPQFLKGVIVGCVSVACEYQDSSWEWSNEQAAITSRDILNKLCDICECDNLQILLTGRQVAEDSKEDVDVKRKETDNEDFKGYMKFVLEKLSESLKKTTWKSYPAVKMVYLHMLELLDHRTIGKHLPYLLPPALFITDDWEKSNKALGLSALRHILTKTPSSELRFYGRAAVIFDALKPHLYARDVEVLDKLYPTILEAAKILEADPSLAGKLRSQTQYEVILEQLLREMYGEQKLALRSLYSRTLPEVIAAMGIVALRWSQDLMEIFEDYLATYDGQNAEDRIRILKGIKRYVLECWPQVHVSIPDITKMLVRLVYDITHEDSDVEPKAVNIISQEIEIIVQLLCDAAPQTMLKACHGITTVPCHDKCRSVLERISAIVESKEIK
ncbi:TELO2-interacting protein 2-like isoform X1 [Penaeus chinensis]|uniref:TELO2-interacting protein 2-like isoform X1 n=1 Tax=Penaeus chinensis TaxID=139456 RepID=UPI001FB81AB2|nr:TELO2-interacting protein 2-like isoform X1 [Penaeus chinensis]XP_047474566.1 TELO2-interacting protein 2-like isoform X1 [Penaeus chinensis]XP_047474567.1 TELO2-interacting protein 2-like isoform X1 [Penaeus chinensis]XP_047474568.1 TELO2-interacting protein 2-like isoform X1 [Penaeus chinensis]XP_047474569.1 TELO2-interacting protein 2-like isoform X1 [Penaeus chinensis]